MTESWPAIAFGWPAIILAIGLAIAGILRRQWQWPIAAALIGIPFTVYLAGSPSLGWIAIGLSPMLAGAGIAVRYRRIKVAWLCLAPFVVVSSWVALVVAIE